MDCPERDAMRNIVENRAAADNLRPRQAQSYAALHIMRRKLLTPAVVKGIADLLDDIALIDEQLEKNGQ